MTPYVQVFTVKLKGKFPFDMLRYDRCFPATQFDVNQLKHEEDEREVKLGRIVFDKRQTPSSSRWETFNCKIHDIQTTKLT